MSRTYAIIADIVAIALFALFARVAHQSEEMPLSFTGWLSTLWPFALGVLLAWVLVVAFKLNGAALFPGGVIIWVVTVITGLAIWAVRNGEMPHWSFILVASVSSALLMFAWRLVVRRKVARENVARESATQPTSV